MEYSLSMLALVCSLVLIPKNAQAAEETNSSKQMHWSAMFGSKKDPKRKKAKKHEKDEKHDKDEKHEKHENTGSLYAIKGDELRARLAQMKAESQSSVKQSEIIELGKPAPIVLLLAKKKRKKLKKPAPVKPEELVLAKKEPEQTIDDELRARFAKRKAGSQSFKDETIEQKLARRKSEALLLAKKEPEETFQGRIKRFNG